MAISKDIKLVEVCQDCVVPMLKAGYSLSPQKKEGKRCFRCGTKVPMWYWFYV